MGWKAWGAAAAALGVAACAGLGGASNSAEPDTHGPHAGQAAPAASQPPVSTLPPAFASPPLSPPALMAHIETLASDAFLGRPPGVPEEEMTLQYLEQVFTAAGLQPGAVGPDGAPSWRQRVPLVSATVTNAPALRIARGDIVRDFAYRTEHVVWTKRLDPEITLEEAPLVFVGYGVVAPELGWNDYAGVDMTGKIAVILINDPDFETGDDRGFGGRAMTYYGRWTYKYEEAARQGAAGALIIHETAPASYPWPVVMSSWTGMQLDTAPGAEATPRVAVEGWVSSAAANELFTRAGLDFAALKTRAQSPGAPPVDMGLTASITLETEIDSSNASSNIVAMIPGRTRPEETVVFTAHWDHLGRCPPVDGDDICNGAADNASGTAGLLELARRFANMGRSERTVAFVAFTAEEKGLLGSIYYAANPVFDPARTAAAINMDNMNVYGPTRDVVVVGYGKSDLDGLLARHAQVQNRVVAAESFPERGGFYRSDHFPLAQVGVPVLYARGGVDLINGGPERGAALSNAYVAQRYHKPDDEIAPDWDLFGASQDLQLFYALGRELADGTDWPAWSESAEFRAAREASADQRR